MEVLLKIELLDGNQFVSPKYFRYNAKILLEEKSWLKFKTTCSVHSI